MDNGSFRHAVSRLEMRQVIGDRNPIIWERRQRQVKSRNIVYLQRCWRRTAGIIVCPECPSSLPDRCNQSTRSFCERHAPTQASAVITPARDSFRIHARSLKSNLAQRHLREATDSASGVGSAVSFPYRDTKQRRCTPSCSQADIVAELGHIDPPARNAALSC